MSEKRPEEELNNFHDESKVMPSMSRAWLPSDYSQLLEGKSFAFSLWTRSIT
jgi:hypothetical protein